LEQSLNIIIMKRERRGGERELVTNLVVRANNAGAIIWPINGCAGIARACRWHTVASLILLGCH